VRIAGLQTRGTPADTAANIEELDRAAREAASHGAHLLITPEMFVTGYDVDVDLADLAGNDLLEAVQSVAARHGIALLVGLPELTEDGVYNAAVFVDDRGAVLGTYRKAHLFGDLDRRLFVPGAAPFGLVEYRGVTVAILICYDVEFPEVVRAAVLSGADLIAVPTAQMTPFAFVAEHLVRSRAWENQVYVAYINHDGVEGRLTYVGRSSLIAPDGSVLDSIEHGTGLIYADVDPAVVTRQRDENPYLTDRRTALYGALAITQGEGHDREH
jgi:predicted amidohydrolase